MCVEKAALFIASSLSSSQRVRPLLRNTCFAANFRAVISTACDLPLPLHRTEAALAAEADLAFPLHCTALAAEGDCPLLLHRTEAALAAEVAATRSMRAMHLTLG